MGDFDRALRFTLRWEGGFVNDPDDPGGRTNKGITQAVYRDWKDDPAADVAQIADEEVAAIYRQNYWDPLCRDLGDPLALVTFDSAVNCGVRRTRGWLDKADSGTVGTLQAAKYMLTVRQLHYETLVTARPRMAKFLRGWLNRLAALREEAGIPLAGDGKSGTL